MFLFFPPTSQWMYVEIVIPLPNKDGSTQYVVVSFQYITFLPYMIYNAHVPSNTDVLQWEGIVPCVERCMVLRPMAKFYTWNESESAMCQMATAYANCFTAYNSVRHTISSSDVVRTIPNGKTIINP